MICTPPHGEGGPRPIKNFGDRAAQPLHVKPENVSNIIFSNLFQPLSSDLLVSRVFDTSGRESRHSVPWTYCDAILSIIRNPLFNPKDVTFTNCADMFRWIGSYREESWAAVESRSQDDQKPGTFPRVVLECVTEFIRSELEDAMRTGRGDTWEHRYPVLHRRRDFCPELAGWTDMLQNMMLVSSSWHGAARPLMGYAALNGSSTVDLIQHPHFGRWTREIYLSCTQSSQIFYPNLESNRFLRSLFARCLGIRLVFLLFESRALTDEFLVELCDDLLVLAALEELTFKVNAGDMDVVRRVSTNLSRSHHSSLSLLRIFIDHSTRSDPLKLQDASTSPETLAALLKLNTIQVTYTSWRSNTTRLYIGGVLWRRTPSAPGLPFMLEELRINWPTESGELEYYISRWNHDAKLTDMLRSATIVSFQFDPLKIFEMKNSPVAIHVSNPIAGMMTSILDLCSSASKLVFHAFRWDRMALFEQIQKGTSTRLWSVEEFVIVITHLPSPPSRAFYPRDRSWYSVDPDETDAARLQFSMNDRQLSEALALGLFPSLRVLKVVFPNEFLDVFVEGFEYGPGHGSERLGKCDDLLLPHTRGVCAERGIEIYVKLV